MNPSQTLSKPRLYLPKTDGSGEKVEINHNGSVVIVGANGSGKSRLGVWIEKNPDTDNNVIVHRISAQRALSIPEYATMKSLEQSLNELLYGHGDFQHANYINKWHYRWQNKPETFVQNDYEKVLSTLFARSAERDRQHTEKTRLEQQYIPVTDAPIDILVKLWQEILPHREVVLEDGKVRVKDIYSRTEYHGQEMSDGEKVALYLMGQCLCVPPGSILVIDEPEIHLHTSIMQSLWNKLEEAKQDCLFVYITHDLNFASTRISTTNIWIKEFKGGTQWIWEEVPEIDDIPENLLLELLGNRRTIVFVEGEKGGKDHSIYQSVYRDYTVVPRNGCKRVIESVRALKLNSSFHHVEVFGIIDRDYSTEQEIKSLKVDGLFCIDVAEIENILLNEQTLFLIAKHLHLNPDDVINRVTEMLKKCLRDDIERQASLRTCREIENNLHKIDNKSIGLEAIKISIENATAALKIDEIYQNNINLYTQLADSGDLNEILKYYNNKGMVAKVCSIFELGKNGYEKIVIRMLNSDNREQIINGLQQYLPKLPKIS